MSLKKQFLIFIRIKLMFILQEYIYMYIYNYVQIPGTG